MMSEWRGLHGLCLGDDIVEYDEYHGASSKCQCVWQNGADELDRETS